MNPYRRRGMIASATFEVPAAVQGMGPHPITITDAGDEFPLTFQDVECRHNGAMVPWREVVYGYECVDNNGRTWFCRTEHDGEFHDDDEVVVTDPALRQQLMQAWDQYHLLDNMAYDQANTARYRLRDHLMAVQAKEEGTV